MSETPFYSGRKLGILGGGQLGRMLCQSASKFNIDTSVLDRDSSFPAAYTCKEFVTGNFLNKEDVLAFGTDLDVITIEIENVNIEALFELERRGKIINPNPSALSIIVDKGKQKEFYKKHTIPTSNFILTEGKSEIKGLIASNRLKLPFVQKARTAGYDGRGVAVIKTEADLAEKILDTASIVEDLVAIEKELSVVVARNKQGEVVTFETVEMIFSDVSNQLDLLLCPADIPEKVQSEVQAIAKNLITIFDIEGILAVEFFLTKDGAILVNEVAPRTHNSGHHTIEAATTSQFEQHLRAVMGYPLGSTKVRKKAALYNLVGEKDHKGPAVYVGLERCLSLEDVHIHIYGKAMTKPYRKMGHVTILGDDIATLIEKANLIRKTLKIISHE